jgi:hypothetical protein
MPNHLAVSAKLSKVLVAFTIEFDNEFEQQFAHRTARGPEAKSGKGPWLVSMAMWSNFLRWVDTDSTPVAEVQDLADLVNFPGLQRWGYIRVADDTVTVTAAGKRAQAIWASLPDLVEARWHERFGAPVVEELRSALRAIVEQLDPARPWYLPVSSVYRARGLPVVHDRTSQSGQLDLAALISRLLIAFRADFEGESRLSLPLSANVVRALSDSPVRVRDLPTSTGVSREAVSISLGWLDRHELAIIDRGPTKSVRLTDRGQRGRAKYERVLAATESAWRARFGVGAIARLDRALDSILGVDSFAEGLEPYPSGWRANPPYATLTKALLANPVAVLPEYPMVSHRGGYPDGS